MSVPAMKQTTVRINEDLKSQAVELLDSIGLSFSAYVTLALQQLVNKRAVPFELSAPAPVPNEQTRRAMLLAEAKEIGLIEDDAVCFNNADELFDYLDAE